MWIADVGFSVVMAAAVGVVFERRAAVGWLAVAGLVGVIACLALLVGGNVFSSFRALGYVAAAVVLSGVVIAAKEARAKMRR